MKNVIYLAYLEMKETKPQNLYLSYNVLISIGESKVTHQWKDSTVYSQKGQAYFRINLIRI